MEELRTKVLETTMSKKQIFEMSTGLILAVVFIIVLSLLRPKAFLILALADLIVNVAFCITSVIKVKDNTELKGLEAVRINAIWQILSSVTGLLMGAVLVWGKMQVPDFMTASAIIAFFYVMWLIINCVCIMWTLKNGKDVQKLSINKFGVVWYGLLAMTLAYTYAKTSLGIITAVVAAGCFSGIAKLTLTGILDFSIYHYFKVRD